MAVFRKTLWEYWGAVSGWSVGVGVLLAVTVAAYHAGLGAGVPNRAQQLDELRLVTGTFAFLFGTQLRLDTMGGFLTWMVLGIWPLLVGVWAVAAGSGMIRGEEEDGILDLHLAGPVSRPALAAGKFAAFTAACAGIGAATGLALVGSGAAFREPLDAGAVGLAALNLATLAWFWGAAALLAGQVIASRRGAAGLAGGLMVAGYLVETNLSLQPDVRSLAQWVPAHWYALNRPLVPGAGWAWEPYLALVGGGLALAGLAVALFARRDLGAAFRPDRRARRFGLRPGGVLAGLGTPFTRHLRDLLGPTLAWGGGLVAYLLLVEASANELYRPIYLLLRGPLGRIAGNVGQMMHLLQGLVLHPVTLLLTGFALAQVAAWTSDLEAGRLELPASTPHRRAALLLARFAAIACATVALVAAIAGAIWGGAVLFHLDLDMRLFPRAMVGLVPLALIVVAGGLALGARLRRPGRAVPVLGAVLLAMYFLELLYPLLDPPDWLLDLSIFNQYGRPFVSPLRTTTILSLGEVALLLLVVALIAFTQRDLMQ